MARWIVARLGLVAVGMALAGWAARPALAAWRLTGTHVSSIAYNQGISFDQAQGSFFFDGVSSTTNSGLYRTTGKLSLRAARLAVIPHTVEGYNHVGDLSFDPGAQPLSSGKSAGSPRLLLPLECYYPDHGGNTCGTGAIGVADPVSLRFRYYVNLDRSQIQKAMWDEISPDGRWIWTSSGTHLFAYNALSVNAATAAGQRAGVAGGIVGKDLGAVLPSSGVTGAAFYVDPHSHASRLLLSLNLGSYFQVVSYETGTARDGSPRLLNATANSEITIKKSLSNAEPEGLAVTGFHGSYPLGGVLHWQMLPATPLYSRILNYTPN